MINKNNYKQNIFEYKITPPKKKKKNVFYFAYLNRGDSTVAKGCNPSTTNLVTTL